jgi:hypothetical protein
MQKWKFVHKIPCTKATEAWLSNSIAMWFVQQRSGGNGREKQNKRKKKITKRERERERIKSQPEARRMFST